jgi:ferric-dicitrate binding protein FerR (iron transport regulator)
MNSHPYADLAARALRRVRAAIYPRPHPGDDQLTRSIGAALTAKRARQRRRRVAALATGALAMGGLIWLAARPGPPPPLAERPRPAMRPASVAMVAAGHVPWGATLADGTGRRPLLAGANIGRGARVAAPAHGAVAMRLSTGTELRLRGELEVLDIGDVERFDLRAGTLDAEVAKLRHGERFVVRAGRAELEVWGTAFEVGLGDCQGRPRTDLAVREGVVAVRADGEERLIRAGERWRSFCPAAPPATPRPPRVLLVPPPAPPEPASSLAAQNQLYLSAVQARGRGDAAAALRLIDRLLEAHPAGPLSEAAMAERMRLLGDHDRTAAADAARAYLRRFPGGFARSEAEALAPEAP